MNFEDIQLNFCVVTVSFLQVKKRKDEIHKD